MRSLEFLFGKKKKKGATISDKLSYGAKSHLDRKIIKNPINQWWIVLLRHYIVWPLGKIPFIPAVEALEARKLFLSFDLARDVLIDAGLRSNVKITRPLIEARDKKIPYHRGILQFVRSVLWKPSVRNIKSDQIRYFIGDSLYWEKSLCTKLFFLTIGLWSLSLVIFSFSFFALLSEGMRPLLKDLTRIFNYGDVANIISYGASSSFKIWSLSCAVWLASLVFSFLLSNRPWIRLTMHVKDFLQESGQFKPDEISGKAVVLALPDVIFLSTPGMSLNKIRSLNSGWPGGFLPGEIIENTKKPEDAIIVKRPEKKPIVFGGDFARTDIADHLKAYDSEIVAVLKNAVKKPSDEELLFIGEVIDPRWWKSSQIFLNLGSSPHCFVVGQTRSGKTKTVLSFVYSFAKAYPDTIWLFADGKGSPDYDPFADYLSIFPVAKPEDKSGDALIQFANVIEYVWSEYSRRRNLFEKARLEGKPCSTIYQYRELVGPLPQIWLVIDEFSVFVNEMGFDTNWRTDGTIANRLKRMVAEAASIGIHLLFASQRYQATDMPTVMRSNLTTRIVHNVQLSDAHLLELPEATTLDKGQFYVTAAGLFCRHTGISKVKAKLPYIGDKPNELLVSTLIPVPKEEKKEFDPHLIFNRGSDDLEKMSVSELCMRLQRFFKDQNYLTTELVADLEATELQLEIVKARKVETKEADGTISSKLKPIAGAPKIGVSLLRADEIDEDTLYGVQAKYNKYPAILIFVVGRSIQSSKYRFVSKLNEIATRFYVVPFREYYKDMRFVEMKRKQGQGVDVIQPKLQRLGLTDVSHTVAAKNLDVSDLSSKSPMKLKVSKILEAVHLDKSQQSGDTRGIPYIQTILPGGTELHFLIVAGKDERDDAKDLALGLAANDKAVVIVSGQKFIQTDIRALKGKGVIVWRSSQVDDILQNLSDKSVSRKFVGDLMEELGLISLNNSASVVKIGAKAKILLSCQISDEGNRVLGCKLTCEITGYTIVVYSAMDIEHYRLDTLGIPETASLTVQDGMAPLGSNLSQVKIAPGAATKKLPESSKWEIVGGILLRKKSKITNDDPLLAEMKGE